MSQFVFFRRDANLAIGPRFRVFWPGRKNVLSRRKCPKPRPFGDLSVFRQAFAQARFAVFAPNSRPAIGRLRGERLLSREMFSIRNAAGIPESRR